MKTLGEFANNLKWKNRKTSDKVYIIRCIMIAIVGVLVPLSGFEVISGDWLLPICISAIALCLILLLWQKSFENQERIIELLENLNGKGEQED